MATAEQNRERWPERVASLTHLMRALTVGAAPFGPRHPPIEVGPQLSTTPSESGSLPDWGTSKDEDSPRGFKPPGPSAERVSRNSARATRVSSIRRRLTLIALEKELRLAKKGGRRPQYSTYTPILATRERILRDRATSEFRKAKWPRPSPRSFRSRRGAYCRYHRSFGHNTEQCRALRDDIEVLVRRGRLRRYVASMERSPAPPTSPTQASAPVAVISIGCRSNHHCTKRSIKRHLQEVHTLGSCLSPEQPNPARSPITFSDEDLPHVKLNSEVPLIVTVTILGIDVRRVLVDQGSSVNVIFKGILPELKLLVEDLVPCRGDNLIGFDGSRLAPVGQLALQTTFGRGTTSRTI